MRARLVPPKQARQWQCWAGGCCERVSFRWVRVREALYLRYLLLLYLCFSLQRERDWKDPGARSRLSPFSHPFKNDILRYSM